MYAHDDANSSSFSVDKTEEDALTVDADVGEELMVEVGDAFTAKAAPSFSTSLSTFLTSESSSTKISDTAHLPKHIACNSDLRAIRRLSCTMERID